MEKQTETRSSDGPKVTPVRHRITLGEWRPSERDLSRFWAKVKKTADCWIWTAARTGAGYGSFAIVAARPPVIESAHRVSYRLAHGVAPAAALMHVCDRPSCVRPDHLVDATNQDNMVDALQKGRLSGRAINLAGPGTSPFNLARRARVAS